MFVRVALIPAIIQDGYPFYWTLLTYTFLHADFGHALINSAMILAVGAGVARMTGGGVFLAIFLLSSLGGGLAIFFLSAPSAPTIGASGGLSGLIGAAAVLLYRYRDTDPRARMMGAMVAIVVVMNLGLALTGGGGISWQGHIGGLLAGIVYGYAALGRNPAAGR
ncbi:MAG: rhomboid family intramembrane serine protease [Minwuia sp.]|uniref:rhomboid family intramembrane serine protease n=1 Tax=Minwuia sp. TaxID=2493630 RepID=UPI003A8A9709